MSVYTTVKPDQLQPFLNRYDLGGICELNPIAAGITNTNYYLVTDCGDFVLTLYEHHRSETLDYILGLQQHLATASVRCPVPISDRHDRLYSTLNQRPAAIFQRLPGEVQANPDVDQCALLASEVARLHLAGRDFAGTRSNPRGIEWLKQTGVRLDASLDRDARRLITATLQQHRAFDTEQLPRGAIHADLFHDNALFYDGRLGGVFDFDYACEDSFVLDLAIIINDWCIAADSGLDPRRVNTLLDAYQKLRPLSSLEIEILPTMLRIGALRFWLSRLYDQIYPLAGELTYCKDPGWFRQLLTNLAMQDRELRALFLPHDMG